MAPRKFGSGHEDLTRETEALRALRGEAEATARAERQVVRETERATEAERASNQERVNTRRLQRENADAAERQRRAATAGTTERGTEISTDEIRRNTAARNANADAMARQAAAARRLTEAQRGALAQAVGQTGVYGGAGGYVGASPRTLQSLQGRGLIEQSTGGYRATAGGLELGGANAAVLARLEADIRQEIRQNQRTYRENLAARGAAAGTLAVGLTNTARRYVIQESTTGQRIHGGSFATLENAQRRLARLMEENIAAQRAITEAAAQRAVTERAMVLASGRELEAYQRLSREMTVNAVTGQNVGQWALPPGARGGMLGPGGPYGGLIRHPNMFGQRDYGPRYGPYAGTGVALETGGAGAFYGQDPRLDALWDSYSYYRRPGQPPPSPRSGMPQRPPLMLPQFSESTMRGAVNEQLREQMRPPGQAKGPTPDSDYVKRVRLTEETARATRGLGGAYEDAASASRHAATEFATADQSMYRHGALTSEFIMSALQGQVTLRDLGTQVAITSGKFAGWTIAAAAVYGVVRAIGQLGHGALESNRAVAELGRYIDHLPTGRAQQQLRNLSRETNLPLDVVSQQVEAAARLTGGVQRHQGPNAALDMATSIARTTLLLSRVGDLDPEVAQKYTAALTTGFKMGHRELSLFVDQLNELQNRMNIPLDVSAQATATAAGTWRSAGGSPMVLASLVAAARRGTGFSGQILGTTFSRSATMIGRPSNRAALQAFGIDSDQSVDDIYQQAIDLVRTHRVRGRQVIQLGEALSTPQLAGRGVVAALRNSAGFREAQGLQQAEQDRGGGSATRELHQVLRSVDEQIRRIGVNLVNLGSALGQSGIFQPLGLMVKLLNDALRFTTFLVEAFDKIPGVLRTPLIILGEMAAFIAVMRRAGTFRAGGALSGAFPALTALDSPVGRTNAGVMRGLTVQRDFARGEREAATRRYGTARFAAESRIGNELEFQRNFDAMQRSGQLPAEGTPEYEEMAAKRRAAMEKIHAEQARLDQMWDEEVMAARKYAERTEEELATFRKMSSEERAKFAVAQGYYSAGSKHPDAAGARPAGEEEPLRATPLGQEVPLATERDVTRESTGRIRGWSQRSEQWAREMRANAGEVGRFGRTGQIVNRALGEGGLAVSRASTFTAGLASGTRRFSGRMREFASSLGALDWAFIGLAVLAELNHISDQASEAQAHTATILNRQNVTPGQVAEQRRVGQAAIQRYSDRTSWTGRAAIRGTFHAVGNQLADVGDLFTGRVFSGDYIDHDARDKLNAQAAEADKRLEDMMTRQQARQRRRHKPIPFRWYDDITRNVDQLIADRAAFEVGQGEFDKRLDKLAIEIQTGRGTRAQRQRALQALAQSRAIQGDRDAAREAVNQLDAKQIMPFMGLQATQLQQFGSGSDQGRRAQMLMEESYGRAVRRWGGSTDPARMQQIQEARQQFFEAVANSANTELQSALNAAGSEGDRQRAYAQADTSARQAVSYAERMQAADRRRLDHAKAIGDKAGVARFARALARDNDEVAAAEKAYDEDQQTRTEAALQDRMQGREIYSQARQAGTADPVRQARDAYRTAQRNLQDARAHGNNRDIQQALQQVRQARQQLVKAELENLQSTDDLSAARGAQDPVSQARAAVTKARDTYRFMQAHRNQFSPAERRQALKDLIDADHALGNAIRQQANDLNDLAGQIAQAQHEGDPVAQAADALRAARNIQIDPNDPTSGPRKRLALIQARNQRKTANDDLARAQGEFQAALLGDDPRTAAEQAIRNDRLAISQAVVGTADWYRARAQLVQDQRGLRDANSDYQQARYEYLESLTTDPVKQAVLQERAARDAIKGTHGAARLRARGNYNRARQNTIATRIQDREDTIDFNLTMERITRDEAISQLESLSKTRGITKQTRRQVLERIKALKDEGDQEASGFALDVGSIKLPTIYDVRRAMGGITRDAVQAGHRIAMHSDTTINIQVNDLRAAHTVYGQIDRAMRTNVRARMRTAGMRG